MKRSPKPSPAVFREAAQLLMEDTSIVFACRALDRAAGSSYSYEQQAFVRLLKPDEAAIGDAWYSRNTLSGCNQHHYAYDEETARVLGLLLCAEMLKDGPL